MRDDINKLNLPPAAKRYARRRGLTSMLRQPKDFLHVNAIISNPGQPNVFRTRDAVGPVKHAFNTRAAMAKIQGR